MLCNGNIVMPQNDFIHNRSRSTCQRKILKSYVQFILHMYIFLSLDCLCQEVVINNLSV